MGVFSCCDATVEAMIDGYMNVRYARRDRRPITVFCDAYTLYLATNNCK